MQILIVETREGFSAEIAASAGMTVMEAIREGGVDELLASCGGNLSCATCHVYVDEGHADSLPAMTLDEDELLDGTNHRQKNSRLSCQIRLSNILYGMRVTIAPED